MAARETTPLREMAHAAAAAGGAGGVSFPTPLKEKMKNLSLLKKMVDDDDDSSSDDENAPAATAAVVVAKGNAVVTGANNALKRPVRPRRSSGSSVTQEKKEKTPSVKKSETKPKNELPVKKSKKTTKNEGEKASVGLNVRSERLQLRVALQESTVSVKASTELPAVGVVTSGEKAKARKRAPKEQAKEEKPTPPRKRRRASSNDPVVQVAQDDTQEKTVMEPSTSKRARLTRKDSREAALKKRKDDEDKKTASKSVLAEFTELMTVSLEVRNDDSTTASLSKIPSPLSVDGNDRTDLISTSLPESNLEERKPVVVALEAAADDPTSDDPKKRGGASASGGVKDEAARTVNSDSETKESHRSKKSKRSRKEDGAKEGVSMPAKAKQGKESTASRPKRRSKVISDESDLSDGEPSVEGSNAENSHRRHVKHEPTKLLTTKTDGVEADKRKGLKRPLSASSALGSKSLSLGALLDRETSGVPVMKAERSSSKDRADPVLSDVIYESKSRLKKESRQETKGDSRRVGKHHELKAISSRADTRREEARAVKRQQSKHGVKQSVALSKKTDRSAMSLDDFIKQQETDESHKHLNKTDDTGEERHTDENRKTNLGENGDSGSDVSRVQHQGVDPFVLERRMDIEEAVLASDEQGVDNSVTETDVAERGAEEKIDKADDLNDRNPPNDPIAEDKPNESILKQGPEKTGESDEDGAVSDEESSKGQNGAIISPTVGTQVAQDETDPMTFVIPKKRPRTDDREPPIPKKEAPAPTVPRQVFVKEKSTPGPPVAPVSTADVTITVTTGTPKPRLKNAVPPQMTPLSQQEKDFFRLAEKSNSLLKAATVTSLRRSTSGVQPRLVSAFGCTTDRYGAMLESGKVFAESTSRMACPTRKQIKSGNHSPSFFGVAMATPPGATANDQYAESVEQPTAPIKAPCYETLEFVKAEDREWYLKRMYGTTFVPQLLRERVTLVMRNARYVRKSAGLLFNVQRDKEEYAAQIAERYTVNRSVPRCDILPKNWQLLVNGRVTFVFLHYMNREDALLARAQFKDDDGQPLIIKGESRANEPVVSSGVRTTISPALSPPPLPSPQPRGRSRSRSNGRSNPPDHRTRDIAMDRAAQELQGDRGSWPPRDGSRGRRKGRRGRRESSNGADASRYGPRSRSRSPHQSSQLGPAGRQMPIQSISHEDGTQGKAHEQNEASQDGGKRHDVEMSSQGTQFSSQATTATQDSSIAGEESQSAEIFNHRRHSIGDRIVGEPRRPRSRSRSRPRMPEDRQPPPSHPGRRDSEDRSYQRDRRSSGDYYSRGHDGRHGRSPPPPAHFDDRHRNARDVDRYSDRDQHYHHQPRYDDRAPFSREYERRGHHEADPHRRPHPHDDRRFH